MSIKYKLSNYRYKFKEKKVSNKDIKSANTINKFCKSIIFGFYEEPTYFDEL